MLRFGRNLGTDPLPANAAHWRKVVVPGQPGGVWINLNASNTRKFSDADFPQWAGWKLIDDDVTDDNSRCDSAAINAMLTSPPQSFVNCATAVNFPGATGQNPPNMNGLVDRSVAFVNALMVLADVPLFENSQQIYEPQPESYVQQRAV
ncbi:hypothetical protein ACSFBM_01030 [Variovorax sp. GB1R11]|uniref:hypothetical protein n=1 Tax=Variovorax sp. GB1R11 TaxID=3443741 RepID=UPI003F471435